MGDKSILDQTAVSPRKLGAGSIPVEEHIFFISIFRVRRPIAGRGGWTILGRGLAQELRLLTLNEPVSHPAAANRYRRMIRKINDCITNVLSVFCGTTDTLQGNVFAGLVPTTVEPTPHREKA